MRQGPRHPTVPRPSSWPTCPTSFEHRSMRSSDFPRSSNLRRRSNRRIATRNTHNTYTRPRSIFSELINGDTSTWPGSRPARSTLRKNPVPIAQLDSLGHQHCVRCCSKRSWSKSIAAIDRLDTLVRVDQIKFKQVSLLNLLCQRRHQIYSSLQRLRHRRLQARQPGDLVISVKDTGIGIPRDQLCKRCSNRLSRWKTI